MRIIVRPVTQSDHNFIFATYLRNRWFDKANTTTLKRSTWSSMQHKRLEGILALEHCLVACIDEDPDTIVGYILLDGKEPWSYVKLDWRRMAPPVKDLLEAEWRK